jgi:hypothetical protein
MSGGIKLTVKQSDIKLQKSNDLYEGSFYFMGAQQLAENNNFSDQVEAQTYKSDVRAEGGLQNPMMSKIFTLINDIDSYLLQNTSR